ncbi:YraN family protein [Candidatus Curtissbacteria bacterium]|nr:YraN family protein [Candidatus Curtissbacteria bacterium]
MPNFIGKTGEDLAVKYLNKLGYKIIERNFRIRGGEIDIVAIDGKTLVYIEVKTRTSHKFGLPQESVTPTKIRFIVRAAKFYRNNRKNLPELERIDVLAIDLIDKIPKYNLIKNASF